MEKNQAQQYVSAAYETYRDILMKEMISYIHDLNLAEDCVQEAFLVLYTALVNDKFEERNLKGYLSSVSHRMALKYISKIYREVSSGDAMDILKLDGEDYEDHGLQHLENRELLYEVMKSLEPLDRRIMLLRLKEKRNYSEIAEAFGVNEKFVRNRVQRSLKIIRKDGKFLRCL